ncbi:MAG TPA: sulfurtransferase TusA family protein [Thermoanaerobaculia bacterium]|nr:sulfurtransferase TusA family protein [Thermoanaerobaculia bacterium]
MRPDVVVDARGFYCPIPVLRLARALRGRPAGFTARLLATDPVAVEDVEIFCRERGHELVESGEAAGVFSFLVRKISPP